MSFWVGSKLQHGAFEIEFPGWLAVFEPKYAPKHIPLKENKFQNGLKPREMI